MDHRTFFEELRECHLENGLPFGYELSGPIVKSIYYGFLSATNKYCYSGKSASPATNKNLATTAIPAKNLSNGSGKWHSFQADIVYAIAWRLSERIGRLPDPLHNRMVFSIDGHPAVARYIRKHG